MRVQLMFIKEAERFCQHLAHLAELYCLTFVSPRGLSLCITRSNVFGHQSRVSHTQQDYCCTANASKQRIRNASFILRYCSWILSSQAEYSVEFWHQKCEISSQAQLEGRRGVNYLFATDRSQRLTTLCWCWYREISVIEPHALITNTCVLSILSYPRTLALFSRMFSECNISCRSIEFYRIWKTPTDLMLNGKWHNPSVV